MNTKTDTVSSYSAAEEMPWKLLSSEMFHQCVRQKRIKPLHVTLFPTNRCNLKCAFCSCSERNLKTEISFDDFKLIAGNLIQQGMKAVTIAGGGEPTLHPQFPEIVLYLKARGVEVGLVTNGYFLNKIPVAVLKEISWCRISASDDRNVTDKIDVTKSRNRITDWAFSYVITHRFDFENLLRHIQFANTYDFTHVRIITDIYSSSELWDILTKVKNHLKDSGLDHGNIIYQGRVDPLPGISKCLVSLLRPVIAADCLMYPCCGIQYTQESMRDMHTKLHMVDARDRLAIGNLYDSQRHFDGSACDKCYYTKYNEVLVPLLSTREHQSFV